MSCHDTFGLQTGACFVKDVKLTINKTRCQSGGGGQALSGNNIIKNLNKYLKIISF